MTDTLLRRLAALALLALAGCGAGRSEPARVEAGGLVLEARVSPPRLRVGENEMEVALRDAEGRPVEHAHVSVSVRMHAMGAMPAMGGPAAVEPAGAGRWRARFGLEMGGTWVVAIEAHRPGAPPLRAEGSLTVGTTGLRLAAVQPALVPAEPAEPSAASAREAPAHETPAATHEGDPGAVEAAAGEREDHAPAPDASAPEAVATRLGAAAGPHPGEFHFDAARLRQLGVASEPARREALEATVRAFGRVVLDESALHDVTMRVGGVVGEVVADALGERVERGQVLFTVYGPELFAAQREYLEALRAQRAAQGTGAPTRADPLVRAAARRLELWGVAAGDVAALARRGEPQEYLPIRAPVSGYVVEKEVVAGSAVTTGQRTYRIAPLDRIWIEAELYEAELGLVAVGQPAEVTLPYAPGRRFEASVAYLYPRVQEERRTARVRLELANSDLVLRPGMYADVVLHRALGERLTVPDSAVLRAGARDFVFLDLGGGRLRPQQVEIGITSNGRVEVLAGLEEGQHVVRSGTFLVAGESRLRAALEAW